ncbi:MAG: Wzz/FepE/Etk N-terminal domain-containing protein, partial [Gammaproteobacteria bacterium]|nr:Wzz/FepE/Etk N-terminal domain-containing protein [Gammaproteobacteria bacterium]
MLTPVDPSSEQVFVADQSEHRGLELLDYWRIVLRYRWSILGVVLIATVIGTLNALSATSIYQAQARLLVKFNAPNISNLQQFEPAPMHWLFFETQSDIIKSHAVAERVVEKLALNKALVGADAERESALDLANDSWGARLRTWLADLKSWLPEELTVPEAPPLDEQGRYAALVDSILGGVTVTGGKESEVLNVNYVSADSKMAANLANTFAEAYIEFGLDSRSSNVQQATSWLGRRIEELRQKVRLSEDALREFKAREDLVDTANREKLISVNLSTLTSELIRAEAQRNEVANHYRQVNSYLNQGSNYEAVASA